MLLDPRYRGLYVHGKVKKVRRAGIVSRVDADATEVITIDLPEWRIVDDDVWARAQEGFRSTSDANQPRTQKRPPTTGAPKYALSRIARRGVCGGSIGVANGRHRRRAVKSYVCVYHHKRGPAVYPVTVYQPMEDVERALVAYVDQHVLTPDVIATMATEIRAAIEAQLPSREADVSELEQELRNVKAEQRRLTKAVALADDVPELVSELRVRGARARALEAQIDTVRRAPAELRALVDQAETTVRERLGNMRAALLEGSDLRAVFLRLFPNGINFHPARIGDRQVWRLQGAAAIGRVALNETDPWFNIEKFPSVSREGSPASQNSTATGREIAQLAAAGAPPTPRRRVGSTIVATPTGFEPVSPA